MKVLLLIIMIVFTSCTGTRWISPKLYAHTYNIGDVVYLQPDSAKVVIWAYNAGNYDVCMCYTAPNGTLVWIKDIPGWIICKK